MGTRSRSPLSMPATMAFTSPTYFTRTRSILGRPGRAGGRNLHVFGYLCAEDEVLRGERGAVMPLQVGTQPPGNLHLPIGQDLPVPVPQAGRLFRQARNQVALQVVDGEAGVED